ncbi:MAG: tetratricopeptide repeat protein [Aquabacterium sp.]|uniref:tetratricopeptide repeat protein n=1 Tax=Aquabacterium sp. TaxID=1872578 RepID=UPI00120CEE20|nr:tetratricopeptide repeat protein [Aquabacterium sp.]TAK99665.1 MAG: tetratricopeptide repeat protein [Aquabacterium sp.]
MKIAFLSLSLALLAVASSFVIWPLCRTQVAHDGGSAIAAPKRWSAVWLVTALAFSSAGLYLWIGEPAALSASPVAAVSRADEAPASPAAQGGVGPAQIAAMVQRLEQRLQTQPNDPKGWRMLIKSYETMGRFDDAVLAYQRLLKQTPADPDLLTDYAVTLGMSKGQTLAGEPEALLDQALKLDPKHIQALALSGSAAFEQRDYKRAVAQWQKLLALVPPDAEVRRSIEANVEKARALIR